MDMGLNNNWLTGKWVKTIVLIFLISLFHMSWGSTQKKVDASSLILLKLYQDQADLDVKGSGLSDKERENPPVMGSIITYKYNAFTSKGNPGFPVYLRIKKSF